VKYYTKFLLCGAICGILLTTAGNVNRGVCDVNSMIMAFGFADVDYYPQYIVDLFFWYMPLMIFQIFYGTYIFRRFCCAGIYFFTRKNNRILWFIKEALKLYMCVLVYIIIMLVAGIIISGIFVPVVWDVNSFVLAMYYIGIHSLFLFATTIALNIISIISSGNVAFIVVEGMCILCGTLYTFMGNYLGEEYIYSHIWLIKANPIAHLIMSVHSSNITNINSIINYKGLCFDLNYSVVLYAVISFMILLSGCAVVKNYDFSTSDKKLEGV
jgi:hypothetical protein